MALNFAWQLSLVQPGTVPLTFASHRVQHATVAGANVGTYVRIGVALMGFANTGGRHGAGICVLLGTGRFDRQQS
jgi:hypothetical protein